MAGDTGHLVVLQWKSIRDYYFAGRRIIDRMRMHLTAVVMAAAQVLHVAVVLKVKLCFCDGPFFMALKAIPTVEVNIGRVGNAALDDDPFLLTGWRRRPHSWRKYRLFLTGFAAG